MKDTNTIKLLLMEDNETFAHMFSRRLRHEGFLVDIAPDGAQGMTMVGNAKYDALVVDHALPGYTGLDVIRMLKDKGALPPTIMLTSTGSESLSVEALKLGVDDYVVKDANLSCLKIFPVILRRVLQRRQDVQQEQTRQHQIQEEREFLEKIVRWAGPHLLLVVSREGHIRKANQIAGDWLGFEANELIGRQCDLYLKLSVDEDTSPSATKRGWKELAGQGGRFEREGKLLSRDGATVSVQVQGTVISAEEGVILQITVSPVASGGGGNASRAQQRCQEAEACLEAAIDRLADWSEMMQEVIGLKEEFRTTLESQIKGPLGVIMDFSKRLLQSELHREQRQHVEELLAGCQEIHKAIEQTSARLEVS